MEISFKKTPVDTLVKNVRGYIPQVQKKGSLAKRINAVYTGGLCKALEKNKGESYVDYAESTVGNLRVFEFSVTRNNKTIKFCHVYDGLFPWKIPKAKKRKIICEIKSVASRRKNFDSSFFEDTERAIERNFGLATVIPREKGYKVIFEKGTISTATQIFTVNF